MADEQRDFDKAASTWDEEPRRAKLAADVAGAITREAGLSPEMDVLDYGCGTGLVSMHILPRVHSVTGADTSKGMLDVLQRKISDAGLTNVRTVLIDPSGDEPVEGKYHLVLSSMTMHHVEDVQSLFKQFHYLLLPGGKLCIADLDKEDGSFHGDTMGVVHTGFERGEIKSMLRSAGFGGIRDLTASVVVKETAGGEPREYPVFLVIASK